MATAGTMVKETIDFRKLEEFWNGFPIAILHMLVVPHVKPTYTWIIIGFGFAIRLYDTSQLPIFSFTQMSLPCLGHATAIKTGHC